MGKIFSDSRSGKIPCGSGKNTSETRKISGRSGKSPGNGKNTVSKREKSAASFNILSFEKVEKMVKISGLNLLAKAKYWHNSQKRSMKKMNLVRKKLV